MGQIKTDLGKRLMDWMIDNPTNAENVAVKVGVSRNTILSVIRGVEPRTEVRCKIEKFLKSEGNKNG
jgi:hypothetical protein